MDARFIGAFPDAARLPDPAGPELAIAGRSNSGKSSLLNALTGRRRLARTSSTPGRTRDLVLFSVTLPGAPSFHLVDLPGYGYAKVSKGERARWARVLPDYIDSRPPLRGLLLLMDIRRGPAAEERDLLGWARRREVVPLVILTKADKLARSRRRAAREAAARALGLDGPPLAVSVREAATVEALRAAVADLVRAAAPAGPHGPAAGGGA